MDPLSPDFTGNLVRQTARIMANMDHVMRPGGIVTGEGLSAAFGAGMQHLAAHQGDVVTAIASMKAAGAASAEPEPSPPSPWPHAISEAEADRLFVAACHASAREAAKAAGPRWTDPVPEVAVPATTGTVSQLSSSDLAPLDGTQTRTSNVELAADDGTPGNNQAQNAQMNAIVRTLGLTKDQRQQLHIEISGQNYGYLEILEIARGMFGK
jgi:hypothetical protein